MASRCQVAHDFTQRHVLAACGEAAIPAPRYLELATQNWFCSGRGRPRAHFFKMLTRRLSLVDDWFDSLIVVQFREIGYIYPVFGRALTSCAERRWQRRRFMLPPMLISCLK